MSLVLCCLFVALTFSPLSGQTASDCDFDGNGEVGFGDYLLFLKAYQTDQAKYDLSGNGTVDFTDFVTFLKFYGQTVSVNLAPTANAGVDQGVEKKDTIALDGSVSSDPDGDSLTYLWTQVYGEGVSLSDSTVGGPSFTAPSAGNYAFELVVSDGALQSNRDTVIVNVVVLAEAAVMVGTEDAPLSYQSAVGVRSRSM